ncbi:conjugal transfer protein TrbB [Mycobacterium adipatum]|uniref:conjugal transfer protein TrbB n=1 Tax=Mycobacterium adipatum TaxID=1682113 RepID=UPI0034E08993
MVLHVGRGSGGARRLTEIAVLGRGPLGWVTAEPAWHADRGFGSGAVKLAELLDQRSRP